MTQESASGKPKPATREDRLKAALKANLARRKAQARARADADNDNKTETSSEGS